MQRTIQSSDLFEGISPDEARRISESGGRRTLGEGEYLFLLGEHADSLFLVLTGRVDVCIPLSIAGKLKDVCVETQGPGGALGWSAYVRPHRFTLSARAAEAAELLELPRARMQKVFEADPRLGHVFTARVAELMGRRLLSMQAILARELQRSVAGGLPSSAGDASAT